MPEVKIYNKTFLKLMQSLALNINKVSQPKINFGQIKQE